MINPKDLPAIYRKYNIEPAPDMFWKDSSEGLTVRACCLGIQYIIKGGDKQDFRFLDSMCHILGINAIFRAGVSSGFAGAIWDRIVSNPEWLRGYAYGESCYKALHFEGMASWQDCKETG